jgi:hypothetical protein
MAWAKPPAEVTSTVAKWNATKVGANSDHDQKFIMVRHGPVCVGREIYVSDIWVSRIVIYEIVYIFCARFLDLLIRPVTYENRSSIPHNGQL